MSWDRAVNARLVLSNDPVQCTGNNVLNGLGVDYNVNIGAWFGGLIGLAIFQYALSSLILSVSPHPVYSPAVR
jgi:hypothetical protein